MHNGQGNLVNLKQSDYVFYDKVLYNMLYYDLK